MKIDRRVVTGFMAIMLAMNAVMLFIPWKQIMTGRNDFPIFYSNAQMVREGQALRLYDFDAENSFVHRVTDVPRPPNNHLPYELLLFVPFTYLALPNGIHALDGSRADDAGRDCINNVEHSTRPLELRADFTYSSRILSGMVLPSARPRFDFAFVAVYAVLLALEARKR